MVDAAKSLADLQAKGLIKQVTAAYLHMSTTWRGASNQSIILYMQPADTGWDYMADNPAVVTTNWQSILLAVVTGAGTADFSPVESNLWRG